MTMAIPKEGADFSDARHHAGCIERGGTAMHPELSEKEKQKFSKAVNKLQLNST